MSTRNPNVRKKLAILATEFHVDLGESYYRIQFFDVDGRKRTLLIGREQFAKPFNVVSALLRANADLPDNTRSATKLVRQAIAKRNRRARRITMCSGWHDGSFVYPGETFGRLAGKLKHEGASEIDPALGLKQGSVQGWQKGLKRAFYYSDYLIFAAGVAFSGPLFELAGEHEGMIFHFQPSTESATDADVKTKSSSGKTLAARVALSSIGRARKNDLISFALTERGAEDYCCCHSNLVGVLDEEGRAAAGGSRQIIDPSRLPYLLTSGRGTVRSKKAIRDPDLKNLTWLLPFITTGERPLDDPQRKASRMEGAQVRMAPVPVPPGRDGGIFNRLMGSPSETVRQAHLLAREVEETLAVNFGVAMPAFLQRVVAERSSLQRRVRLTIDKFVKVVQADTDPWERRLAEKFGIVVAGAILASEFGVAPWSKQRAWQAVRTIYRRSRSALASVEEATNSLIDRLRQALSDCRFPPLKKGETLKPEDAGAAWGVTRKFARHGSLVLITLARLQSLITPRIISDVVIRELADSGILLKSPDGKTTREAMIQGLNGSRRRRYAALKLSRLMEEGGLD